METVLVREPVRDDARRRGRREIRRQQRGLLLLTAHRAKGLEFDHVMVLDNGGWNRVGQAEDTDAPRRLYYVAMTRASKPSPWLTCREQIRSWMHYATFLRSAARRTGEPSGDATSGLPAVPAAQPA